MPIAGDANVGESRIPIRWRNRQFDFAARAERCIRRSVRVESRDAELMVVVVADAGMILDVQLAADDEGTVVEQRCCLRKVVLVAPDVETDMRGAAGAVARVDERACRTGVRR